jgi:cell division topological specificity factor
MLEILKRINFWNPFSSDDSAKKAKDRLRLVLIQDQSSISEGLLGTLRREMIGVISHYLEIDSTRLEFGLERQDGTVALAASIPILRIKPEGKFVPEVSADTVPEQTHSPSQSQLTPRKFHRVRRKKYGS